MFNIPEDASHFITRDLVFLVGGSFVVSSFLYCFGDLPGQGTPFAYYLVAAGVAYVVGYALQDGFTVLHVVTTADVTKPWRPQRVLYKLFTRRDWEDVEALDWNQKSEAKLAKFDDDSYRAAYQRQITLMMVGATVAPCALLSAFFLRWSWKYSHASYDLALSRAAFALFIVLWAVNWIKALQVTQTNARAIRDYDPADQAT